jgi:hypothetical protein
MSARWQPFCRALGTVAVASASVSLERAEDCEGYDEHGEG